MMAAVSLLLGNEWARLGMVAVFCFGFGWAKGWGAYPRVDIAAIERNAIAGRDSEWEKKLREAEEDHEKHIAAALEAAQSVSATPELAAERMRLCKSDTACREHKDSGHGVQGVPKNPVERR